MKSGWTPELERLVRRVDPIARLIPEVVAHGAEDVRQTPDGWRLADSQEGLSIRADGALELGAGDVVEDVSSTASDDYRTTLLRGASQVARLEFHTRSAPWRPSFVDAWLVGQVDAMVPANVARWGLQVLQLQSHAQQSLAQAEPWDVFVEPVHETVYVPAAATPNPGLVRFDLSALQFYSRMLAPEYVGPPGEHVVLPPTFFLMVWGVQADGSPATGTGWGVDTARNEQRIGGITLTGWEFTNEGQTRGSWIGGVPRLTIVSRTLAPATVSFTTHLIDLGSVPADDVELAGGGQVPAGTSIVYEVQADDATWVEFRDGDLVDVDNTPAGGTNLSATGAHRVTRRQWYALRAHLVPAETIGPVLTSLGARTVERTLLDGDATWTPRGAWAVDPVTLRGEVMEGALTLPRTGERDYRDAGSLLFSRSYVGGMVVRLWIGHPDLPRHLWLLVDEQLVDDFDSAAAAIVATTLSPLAHTRAKIPPAEHTTPTLVTRDPIDFANVTIGVAYDELLRSAIAVPERFRGPGISEAIVDTVSKRIEDADGKSELDALARLAGGSVLCSQGRIRWVDMMGEMAVVATFPREEVKAVQLTPGLRQRVPEFFVPYQWVDDEGGSRYRAMVRSFNIPALQRLGTANLDAPRELPDDVARWIDSDPLAERVARTTTETLGPGLMLWAFEALYPHPELEPGDLVSVQVDAFVSRDPIADRELRGRLWATGVVQSIADPWGRLITVWIRRWSDIAYDQEPVQPVAGTATLLEIVEDDGKISWVRGPETEDVWSAAEIFTSETLANWDVVKNASLPLAGDELVIQEVPEGKILLGQIEAVTRDGRIGQVHRFRRPGTRAPLDWMVTARENAAGTIATVCAAVVDPRGVISGVNRYVTEPGRPEGAAQAAAAAGPSAWEFDARLFSGHNVLVRLEGTRNDGLPPVPIGTITLDADKVPAIPEARVQDRDPADPTQATVYVDAADPDTATLWYREVLGGGGLGVETPIAARGIDPRLGAFSITATAGRRFRIFGRNADGLAGQYLDFLVPGLLPHVRIGSITPDGGGTAWVTANGDDVVAVGLGGMEYQLDSGAWEEAVVGTDRSAVFEAAQFTAGPRALKVRGISAGGEPGPPESAEVPRYVAAPVLAPALTSAVIAINIPGAGGAGTDDWVVGWTLQGNVNTTDHNLVIELHYGDPASLSSLYATLIINPTLGQHTHSSAHELSERRWAVLQLVRSADGGHVGAALKTNTVTA